MDLSRSTTTNTLLTATTRTHRPLPVDRDKPDFLCLREFIDAKAGRTPAFLFLVNVEMVEYCM
jgi:hypothetical protein